MQVRSFVRLRVLCGEKRHPARQRQHSVSGDYTGVLVNFRLGYFLYTTPPFITNATFFTTPMSSSGSPGTATMSA